MVMADVTDEMVRRVAEALHYHSEGDDAAPPTESDIQFWQSYAEAALSAAAPLIAAQAHREAFNVAHAFARTGVDGILARLVDLLDGEIRPSDAAAQARREALEEAAAYVDRVADEYERLARTCEPSDEMTRVDLNNVAASHRSVAKAIRLLANKTKETTP